MNRPSIVSTETKDIFTLHVSSVLLNAIDTGVLGAFAPVPVWKVLKNEKTDKFIDVFKIDILLVTFQFLNGRWASLSQILNTPRDTLLLLLGRIAAMARDRGLILEAEYW